MTGDIVSKNGVVANAVAWRTSNAKAAVSNKLYPFMYGDRVKSKCFGWTGFVISGGPIEADVMWGENGKQWRENHVLVSDLVANSEGVASNGYNPEDHPEYEAARRQLSDILSAARFLDANLYALERKSKSPDATKEDVEAYRLFREIVAAW